MMDGTVMNKLYICILLPLVLGLVLSDRLTAQDQHAVTGPPVKEFREGDTFVIALIPEKNIFDQRRRYKYIIDYLSRELKLDVYLKILPSYGNICSELLSGKADAGFFGSFGYALTHERAGIEPVARPVWTDGSSTYSGYIFVRKDSGISRAEEMGGKRLSLVHKATTAGYVFQLDYLKKHGIDLSGDFFSGVTYAGSHDASAWAVYTGEAEVGGGKNHVFNALSREYPDFKRQMTVLEESPEVPSNGLALGVHVDHDLRDRIKRLLIALDQSKEGISILNKFGALKFISTDHEDYAPLYRMIEDAGIDLNSYSCEN